MELGLHTRLLPTTEKVTVLLCVGRAFWPRASSQQNRGCGHIQAAVVGGLVGWLVVAFVSRLVVGGVCCLVVLFARCYLYYRGGGIALRLLIWHDERLCLLVALLPLLVGCRSSSWVVRMSAKLFRCWCITDNLNITLR